MNMRLEYEELRKALTTGTANGANVLQPQVLSNVIVDYVQIVPTIRNYIKRIDWPTMVFNWDNRTVPGTATSAADGATIPFSDSTFTQGSNALSQLYSLFQITNAAKLGAQPLVDIVASELQARMKQLIRLEDKFICQGDPNNASGNPGLISQTTSTAPTSAVGGSGKTITHALMDNIETYQNANGFEVDAWFVSKGIYALLKTVAFNSVRFTNITPESEVMVGYSQSPTRALLFNGKPVVLDNYMYSGGENAIAVSLDPNNLITASRLEPVVEDFARVLPQFDGDSWRIKEYTTTVLKNPNSAVGLYNVTIPAVGSSDSLLGNIEAASFRTAAFLHTVLGEVLIMSTPISYVTITETLPYCTIQDIKNLIGSVMPIANGTFTDAQIQAAIGPAQRYIDNSCNRTFHPHRKVYQFDGNGTARCVIKERPFININQLSVYFTYPMNLSRIAYDYQLLTDHGAGIISFPLYYGAAMFAPFAYVFIRGTRNITLDLQVGFSSDQFSQTLTTTDNLTYTFPVSNVVNKSIVTAPDDSMPPSISPIIYVNGTPLVNTTYTYVQQSPQSQGQWEIQTDSIYYTVNSDGSGITSITFNTPQTGAITADFTAAYIPADINEACAKYAAIRCLSSMGTMWYMNQFDGLQSTQSAGTRIELHNSGRFGHAIDLWNTDIQNIINVNQRIALGSIGSSFDGNGFGYGHGW